MKSDRTVVELTALRVERDAVILGRIDWRVERGENWAILGANGSGKTSILRALTGYLPPTAGQIRVLGETYGRSDWRALRTRIGLVSSSVHQMMEDRDGSQSRRQRTLRANRLLGRDERARPPRFWPKSRPTSSAIARGHFCPGANASAC